MTDEYWKEKLTEEEYRVLREKGTENPFSGEYNLVFDKGEYRCKGCGELLFASDSKFDHGCGWPSFDRVIDKRTVREILDLTKGMLRTEIICAKCGGHLGHLFDDGPTETGMRYCINSVSLDFKNK